ncbi:MAG: DNA double-strand break repair nuclease NurA [Methanotrichaceae archaeon]|nr:DNA double-strand break repair nuclease NurA [Methanotrichaceae archaeon]
MLKKSRLEEVADLLSDRTSPKGIKQFYENTGIFQDDFIQIEPMKFDGHTYAIDGSNVVICSWSVASLNWIRAGYVKYCDRAWLRTVITYDDAFLAAAEEYAEEFSPYLVGIFGLEVLDLEETELERLSSYFRELQEYVALLDALRSARSGDLILYDGGFAHWKSRLLKGALGVILKEAEEQNIDVLGVSKSNTFAWGPDFSRPFVQFAGLVGSLVAPRKPWYICLSKKNIRPNPDGWDGKIYVVRFDGGSDNAFRVDAPSFVADRIGYTLGKLINCACSAECYGYPHALFRAHREIRIKDQEKNAEKLKFLNLLSQRGLTEFQLRSLLLDFHDVIEVKSRGII